MLITPVQSGLGRANLFAAFSYTRAVRPLGCALCHLMLASAERMKTVIQNQEKLAISCTCMASEFNRVQYKLEF